LRCLSVGETVRPRFLDADFWARTPGTVTSAYLPGKAETRAQDDRRVIDRTDNLVFDPDEATVAPGTTVVWENVSSAGHSVTPYEDEILDEPEYFASGDFESEQAARDAYPEGEIAGDETYQHTFEVEGTHGYFCIPHERAGMVAELTVSSDAGGDGGSGGEGGVVPGIPESAPVVGIVTLAAMVSVVALAYFFLKYGGDYRVE
jgi:plastocyanin